MPTTLCMDRLPELIAAYPRLFTSQEFAELQSELPAGWYGLIPACPCTGGLPDKLD